LSYTPERGSESKKPDSLSHGELVNWRQQSLRKIRQQTPRRWGGNPAEERTLPESKPIRYVN